MEAIGLALCQHNGSSGKFLFQMPRYCDLKPGDLVVVDTKHGEQEARVVVATTMYFGEDDYKMILAATGATLPLRKVLKKVVYRDLFYEGEDFLEEEQTDE